MLLILQSDWGVKDLLGFFSSKMLQIRLISIIFVALNIFDFALSTNWVLLVAGSNEYINYRDQANVFRVYQSMKSRGIPDENIILMLYDDIAYNEKNPTTGKVINQPNGPNVYSDVYIDYSGCCVTAQNILNVLAGMEEEMIGVGTGEVIKSTEEDNIFVYYSDHGGSGILGAVEDQVYAEDLYEVLKQMVENRKFNKMVLFVQARYAGSMFDWILEEDWNIFVMTAADPHEAAHTYYWDDYLEAYIGDEFSAKTWELIDTGEADDKTLHHVFAKVRTAVEYSHVQEYGNLLLGECKLSEFIGVTQAPFNITEEYDSNGQDMAIDPIDIPLAMLRMKIGLTESASDQEQYESEMADILAVRVRINKAVNDIIDYLCGGDDEKISDFEDGEILSNINQGNMHCAKVVVQTFSDHCFNIVEYPYVRLVTSDLIKACNAEWITTDDAVEAIKAVCCT